MDVCLAKVELAFGRMQDQFENTKARINELDSMRRYKVPSMKPWTQLTQKNTALEVIMVAIGDRKSVV